MSYPVYVLLPRDVEWTPVPGSVAQSPSPVRWYLRTQMPEAATQTVVLVSEDVDVPTCLAEISACAAQLGGVALDGSTQQQLDVTPA